MTHGVPTLIALLAVLSLSACSASASGFTLRDALARPSGECFANGVRLSRCPQLDDSLAWTEFDCTVARYAEGRASCSEDRWLLVLQRTTWQANVVVTRSHFRCCEGQTDFELTRLALRYFGACHDRDLACLHSSVQVRYGVSPVADAALEAWHGYAFPRLSATCGAGDVEVSENRAPLRLPRFEQVSIPDDLAATTVLHNNEVEFGGVPLTCQ